MIYPLVYVQPPAALCVPRRPALRFALSFPAMTPPAGGLEVPLPLLLRPPLTPPALRDGLVTAPPGPPVVGLVTVALLRRPAI